MASPSSGRCSRDSAGHDRVPEKDELKPLDELVQEALANRVEVQQARLNLESNRMLLVGIKNELKPKLQAFVELTNNGLSGVANPTLGNRSCP